ncbi:MAG: hypothetical protein ABIU95_15940, partial [Burkholderiales bacterium]
MSTNAPRDPALHDATIGEGYRDASARLEPSAQLDDAIRARARRAVASRPQPVQPSWTRRGAVPFALAASLVL